MTDKDPSSSRLLLLLVLLVIVMVNVEAFAVSFSLVPSQVLIQHSPSRFQSLQASVVTEQDSMTPPKTVRKKKRSKGKKKRQSARTSELDPLAHGEAASQSGESHLDRVPNEKKITQVSIHSISPKAGDYPDVYWRSIPMKHLRRHPKFQPLPRAQEIKRLDCLEDARLFRQDSWQWDALHHGRCTTSQAVAALGFLEPQTGQALGVPVYWQRGGLGAFHRLRQNAVRTLEDMNRVLCAHGEDEDDEEELEQSLLWAERAENDANTDNERSFQYEYLYQTPESEIKRRKASLRRLFQNQVSIKAIRMAWGDAQESTSILTALNYFAGKDPGFVMKEAGMCGAGLELNQTTMSSLLVGASPDAILCHSDGSIEALEVKNHCPFMVPWISKGKPRSHRFVVGDFPFDDKVKVFSHYIPQLMMEMLCLGPECRSVVLVRQTATNGALLLRLYRDDEWIKDMMHFLERFQSEFVAANKPPPQNFFWADQGDANKNESVRYRRFVNRTLDIRNKIEVITHIPHEKIQRVAAAAPLFLD